MKIGTKSILFGIHQFIIHPIVVYKAWCFLYGKPSFKELICIIVHDWGYWGKPDLDGPEGITHPALGAIIVNKLFKRNRWYYLCAGHSRSYCKFINDQLGYEVLQISKLCWADKLSFCFENRTFYMMRANLSGEWHEIYELCLHEGMIKFWHNKLQVYKILWIYMRYQDDICALLDPEVLTLPQKYDINLHINYHD